MFLSDHETDVDLLYYDAIAKTVVKLIFGGPDVPLTIGIHGDWGAGKSSVLAMLEKEFKQDQNVLCVRFNGWQFQGFEDAKAALIEAIITELRDARGNFEKVKEKATDLLKRVDYLKIAKKGFGWGFSLATGIPHPEQIKDAASLLNTIVQTAKGDITQEKIKETLSGVEGFLKPGGEKKLPEQMRAFHKEFEGLLQASELKKLIVLIDDLDRCLPDTAIETLEAIRLFLFTKKTAFVIAADEAMIEYAVKQHFPDLPSTTGPSTYARNYLEKLIQVPFRIPALGYTETQIYVILALLEAELGSGDQNFQKLLQKARESICMPWKGVILDQKTADECLLSDGQAAIPSEVRQAITLSGQISRILTDGTKGNPRQVKRFLNSLNLRHQIAEARGLGNEIKLPVLAKVMLAESFSPLFYDQLTKATYMAPDGKPKELVALEGTVRIDATQVGGSKSDSVDPESILNTPKDGSDWINDEWIKNWGKIDPPLKNIDLRPYIFVTRDKRSYFGGATGVGHLDNLIEALMGKQLAVKSVESQLSKLTQGEAGQVFTAIQSKMMQAEEFKEHRHGLIALAKAHPQLQKKLLTFIGEIPIAKLGGWAATGFNTVFTDPILKTEYEAHRKKWGEQDENPELRAAVRTFSNKQKK